MVSTAGRYGNIAWYERVPNRCVDCGQFVSTFPARSVRDGAAVPVCPKHATAAEVAEKERLGREYDGWIWKRLDGNQPDANRTMREEPRKITAETDEVQRTRGAGGQAPERNEPRGGTGNRRQ